MTLKELSQLYHLRGEIEADKERLRKLELEAGSPSSPKIDGMPKSGSVGSKVERDAAEIVDLRDLIAAKQLRCETERLRLERWISEIPDSLTRQIFQYRFSECLSWFAVSDRITQIYGKEYTDYAVKKRCYRYLKDQKK